MLSTRRHLLVGLSASALLLPVQRVRAQTVIIVGQPPSGAAPPACTTPTDAFVVPQDSSTQVGATSASLNVASKFTAANSYSLCKVICYLSQTGTAPFTVVASIFSHNSGTDEPASLLGAASSSVTASTIPTTETAVTFSNMSATIVSGTIYWVVLTASVVGSGTNCLRWWRGPATGTPKIMTDANAVGTWTLSTSTKSARFQAYS